MNLLQKFARLALKIPYVKRYYTLWYRLLGINDISGVGKYLIFNTTIIGDVGFIYLHKHAEINSNCFLLAKDKIEIGENSTLAYGVTVLTSANPNSPHNKLAELYPAMTAPVNIGNNVWVGANATILPGVTIGDFSVIAAGSVVNKDVPSGVLVAGNPAVFKKKLDNI